MTVEQRTHVYTDDSGQQIARKLINKDEHGNKHCGWEQFADGRWVKGTGKVTVPLYRADKLLLITPPNEYEPALLFIVEGEKDVETLERLDFNATTTPAGAWKPLYNKYVDRDNLKVIILSDNDKAGEDKARKVYEGVQQVNPTVCWIKPTTILYDCPLKGDISDIVAVLGDERAKQYIWNAVNDSATAENMDNVNVLALPTLKKLPLNGFGFPTYRAAKSRL